MKTWFGVLFIIGLIVGWLIPGDINMFVKKVSGPMLKPDVFDVSKRLGQLDKETPYFKYTILAEAETGGVELLRLEDRVPLHMHPKEKHFVYIFKGRAKGTIGNSTAEVGPNQLVVIPAGVPHSFERIGDAPVEIIVFSTPPFKPNDTVFLENK